MKQSQRIHDLERALTTLHVECRTIGPDTLYQGSALATEVERILSAGRPPKKIMRVRKDFT